MVNDSLWGYPDNSLAAIAIASSGTGNLNIPANFGVLEGANFVYCMITMRCNVSTGSFALHPSASTGLTYMELSAHGDTVKSQLHGIMPLDSTGGLYYTISDTAESATLSVFAWMV